MKKVVIVILVVVLLANCHFSYVRAENAIPSSSNESTSDNTNEFDDINNCHTRLLAFHATNEYEPIASDNIRAAYFNSVGAKVYSHYGQYAFTDSYNRFVKTGNNHAIIPYLQYSTILFMHTHGAAGLLYISVDSPQFLYTFDLANTTLSNLQCVVLLSCKGGKYIPSTTNMVQTMVNCGASCVVGFNDDIAVGDANLFAEAFAALTMQYGLNVNQAVQYISSMPSLSTIGSAAVIGGNPVTSLY